MGATIPPKNPISGPVINGLGDSITSFSGYSPYGTSTANVPQWVASTAYSLDTVVQNNGLVYYCTTAGTSASSGGPTGTSNNITDGSAHWAYEYFVTLKSTSSYLTWTEVFSLGRIVWDMSKGYGGFTNSLLKVIVVNGGTSYSGSDTITFNNGATGTLTVVNGVITAVNITNPGFNGGAIGSSFTYSITTSTGSGAVLSTVQGGTGTFGVPGCKTADMVARLPDVIASGIDVCIILGGTNDISAATSTIAGIASAYTTITTNLKNCYETIMSAGIKVVAVPVTPRTGLTLLQVNLLCSVNEWIRGYCRKQLSVNPNGYTAIVVADATTYLADGTSIAVDPIGSATAASNSMTIDGLHLSQRGAMYVGMAILEALEQFINGIPTSQSRPASMADGFDLNYNPRGNCLEGFPWIASNVYVSRQICSNSGNVYRCTAGGTSAGSGGPSGTTTFSDGTVTWAYVRPNGCSVFASGTAGTLTAATGITYSGNLATGYTLSRAVGTATGTVTCAIENPWSNGQIGQRQSISWNLSAGGNTEFWNLVFANSGAAAFGIQTSDLGVGLYYMELELELSAVSNLTQASIFFSDGTLTSQAWASHAGYFKTQGVASNLNTMNSADEMLPIPNNGKMVLRTQPIAIPANLNGVNPSMTFAFNATSSATLTAKLNYLAIRRAF